MENNPVIYLESTTKKCPSCAQEIKAEALVCRYCKARFDVVIKGYCFQDHQLVEADENGNCSLCHGELIDLHVESTLLEGTTAEAQSAKGALPVPATTVQLTGQEQPPIPATIDSKELKPAEIHCHKCSTINPTTAITCQKCGINLLPGTSMALRLGILAATIIMTITFGMVAMNLLSKPGISHRLIVCLGIMAIGLLVAGVRFAFAQNPPHERYYERARRHLKLNPLQAIADLTEARELAPQKEKEKYILEATNLQVGIAGDSAAATRALIQICTEALVVTTHKSKADLLNERAKLYVKVGMEEDSTRDLLEATYEIERAIKSQEFNASRESKALGNLVTGGFGDAFADGISRQNVKQAMLSVGNQRSQLMKEGKIQAIGYCSKCKDAVVVNIDGVCEQCGRPPKRKEAIYIMPADLEQTKTNVRQKRRVR